MLKTISEQRQLIQGTYRIKRIRMGELAAQHFKEHAKKLGISRAVFLESAVIQAFNDKAKPKGKVRVGPDAVLVTVRVLWDSYETIESDPEVFGFASYVRFAAYRAAKLPIPYTRRRTPDGVKSFFPPSRPPRDADQRKEWLKKKIAKYQRELDMLNES